MNKDDTEYVILLVDNAIRRIRNAKGRGWEQELEYIKKWIRQDNENYNTCQQAQNISEQKEGTQLACTVCEDV